MSFDKKYLSTSFITLKILYEKNITLRYCFVIADGMQQQSTRPGQIYNAAAKAGNSNGFNKYGPTISYRRSGYDCSANNNDRTIGSAKDLSSHGSSTGSKRRAES
jgi:hypothetical protein